MITLGDGLISVFGAYPIWDSGLLLFSSSFFPVLVDNSFSKFPLKEAPPVRFFPAEGLEHQVGVSAKHFFYFLDTLECLGFKCTNILCFLFP